eukprot:scaffold6922_cov147-Skeletonema_menzelii.AAC.5
MMWLSVLSIGLVSTILPAEAADKGANSPLLKHGNLRPRMMRAEKMLDKKPKPEIKPKPGDKNETEAVDNSFEEESFPDRLWVPDTDTNSSSTEAGGGLELLQQVTVLEASNMTNTAIVDDVLLNETVTENEAVTEDETATEYVQSEEESSYSSNVALAKLDDTTPKGLPLITFSITTDSETEEIDTSELSSVLSDYLMEQLTDKFPESWLVQVELDVNYEYKPEKDEVEGVGFEADEEDSLHIFTATGAVYVDNDSTEIPTENQLYAKTRDSVAKEGAEAAILSLLQESEDSNLQEAKTFSVSQVKPRVASPLLEDNSSTIPHTLDAFIGLTAVLALLAGAYIARDRAKEIADDQEPKVSFDDEESVDYTKKIAEDVATQPPTPPSTPPSTPAATPSTFPSRPAPTTTRPTPRLICLSDFNIIDEISHLGDTVTRGEERTLEGGYATPNNHIQQQPSILRPSTARTRRPATSFDETTAVSAAPSVLALSDFNIVDELMCMHEEMNTQPSTQPSRHVKFDVDNETNTTSGDTSIQIFDELGCGPVTLADGVRIAPDDLRTTRSSKTNKSSGLGGLFDCRVEDLNVFGGDSYDDDFRSETISYYSGDSEYTY